MTKVRWICMPECCRYAQRRFHVGSCSAWPSQLNAAVLSLAGRRLQRTVQLLLLLAAYLLVTAVLKSSLDLRKRTCCVLALGEPLPAVYRIAQPRPCDDAAESCVTLGQNHGAL